MNQAMQRMQTSPEVNQQGEALPHIDIFPDNAGWTSDFEDIVQAIRLNAEGLSLHHRKQYVRYKILIRCFRIPTIIVSSIAAVVSAGFLTFLDASSSLTITCVLNLVIGVLAGLELFLGVERNMMAELAAHRAYAGLACSTAALLRLDRRHRPANAAATTDELVAHHTLLLQSSSSAVGFVHENAFESLNVARHSIGSGSVAAPSSAKTFAA